jgi:uncharacterized protein YbjT (DUF2867 family)
MFVIAGVTGHTGAVVANTLLAQGHKVRVIVRSAEKAEAFRAKGAEVALADLGDVAALTKALTGATAAYLLSPPNFAAKDFLADRAELVANMAKAITASGLKRLVFLSSVAAQHPAGTGPIVSVHRAEQAFSKLVPSITFLRPAYFIENWGSMVPVMKAQGVLPHFGPVDVKFAQICTHDIGLAAVDALLTPADGVRTVELAGPQDWSVQDIAAAFSTLLGKPVHAVSAPVEGAKAGLLQAGMPESMATLYGEMYQGMGKGLVAFERPGSITRGRTPLMDALKPLVG